MSTVVKIGTQTQVNSGTTGGQWYPTVTGLANGGYVVTWQDGLSGFNGSGSDTLGDASGSAVKGQIYAADGSAVGGEFLVNTQVTGSQAAPAVASLSNGGFVVSWQDTNSTSGDIKAQIYGADGSKLGTEFTVNTVTANNQNTPTITGLPGGGFVVAWTNQGSSAPDVKAQVYDANGVKVGAEFLVNTTSPYDQERASIATLANGDFVVTWNDFRTGNWEARGQVFHPTASGATKVGAEFVVDTAFYNSRMTSPVTGLANGNFVVSYEDTSGEVRAQVYTPGGAKVGTSFVVNTLTAGNQGFPSITALTTGGFVVTWSDEGTGDGSSSGIKAQVYDAAGAKVGGEYLVNSQTSGPQYYPTVAALANGGFVISWQDFSQALSDKSSYGIVSQVFNIADAPNAPAIVSVTDDVAPITGTVANGGSTNDTNLTVRVATGSSFAGDTVQLYDGSTAIGSAVVLTIADIARGYVDIQTGALGDATHALNAKVTDTTGAQSAAGTAVNITVDTVAGPVAVTGVALDKSNLPTVTVNGTAEAGSSVAVYDGINLVGTVIAGNDGAWNLPGVVLAEGANNLSAKATDAAGNVGTSTTFAAPTVVSTGTVTVTGATTTSMGYIVIGSGTLDIVAGADVTGQITVGNGGTVAVEPGATAEHTEVLAGGTQFDYGTATGTTVQNGGFQHVYWGGSATGTVIAAGGFQNVWNSSVTDTDLSGAQQVLDNATAVHTVIHNGGNQYVGSGGSVTDTVIETGGFQYVDTGATATDTLISGGAQYVAGTATGTVGNGGSASGGGVSDGSTISNGGVQHVVYGGSATNTTVEADGFQDVLNGTVTDTNLMGDQQILAGGVSIHTTVANGASEYVGAGGTAIDSVIEAGGTQYVATGGIATGSTVNGGYVYVAGTSSVATINGGGAIEIGAGGVANGTHLVHGVELVHAGGKAQGVDFAGEAGTLSLEDAASLKGTVSNFEIGDTIDLLNSSVSSYAFDGSVLTLTTNTGSYSYKFANVQSGTEFSVGSDGHGGTAISLSLLVQSSASLVPDAGTETVLSTPDQTLTQPTLASAHA